MMPAAPAAPGRAAVRPRPTWSGLLLLDKPAGLTSHDVVDKVRRRLRVRSAGHLGTLDPGASGLLVVAIGAATRCAQVWQGGEKTYDAVVRFGVVTSTQDLQGDVLERHEVALEEEAVRDAARSLLGQIDQVPPMVSALKVGGQRLYKLARRGEVVERQARRITVHEWEWQGFAMPDASFRVRCSGGTYVRTLAHDLGGLLGVGGALKSLRRLESAPFGIEQALPLRALDERAAEEVFEAGIPLDRALEVLPAVALDADSALALGFGRRPLVEPALVPLSAGPRSVVLRDLTGRALALGELLPDPAGSSLALACPHVVFPWAVREGA